MTTDKNSDQRGGAKKDAADDAGAKPQPIDVARVRHLLKTTRYNSQSTVTRPAKSDGGPSLFGARTGSKPGPSQTTQRAGQRATIPAPGTKPSSQEGARNLSQRPAPKPDRAERNPIEGKRERTPPTPARQRVFEAPARVHRAHNPSSWFASQPEMQRLAQLSDQSPVSGQPPGEQDRGTISEFDVPDRGGRRASRSFDELNQESWFAHQPEVQRVIGGKAGAVGRDQPQELGHITTEQITAEPRGMDAQRFEPPPAEFERQMPGGPISRKPASGTGFADYSQSPHSGPELAAPSTYPDSASGAVAYGDFSEASSWFANQPEFQRMQSEQRARGRRHLPRWALWAGLLAVAGGVVWGTGLLSFGDLAGRIDLDRLRSVAGLDRAADTAAGIQITPEPVVVLPESARSASPTGSQSAKATVGRAPTAVGPIVPQSGGVTLIAKTRAPNETAIPAFTRTVDFTAQPAEDGQRSANGDQQSVLTPTGGARPASRQGPEEALDPDGNVFEGFSEPGTSNPEAAEPSGDDLTGRERESTAPSPAAAGEIESAVNEARRLFVGGDHIGAKQILRDVIASDPGNVPALKLYGDVLVGTRELDAATEIYERILTLKPGDDQTMADRGNALLGVGKLNAAVSAAEDALAISADSVPATLLLSKAKAASGDMRAAMTACERIGALTSSRSEVEWCRAAAQNQAGNTFVGVRMYISALNKGEQGFVRSKQVFMRDRGLYEGPIDGASSQSLIDAVTTCAAASDCVL